MEYIKKGCEYMENDINKKFTDLVERIRLEVKISDVVKMRVEVKKKGQNYVAICPFHNGTNFGSLQINDRKGIFKCFKCGCGGDAIKFVQEFDKIKRKNAILIIAKQLEMISEEDINEMLNEDFKMDFVYKNMPDRIEIKNLADEETLNFVYSVLCTGQKLSSISNKSISDDHKQYLLSRGLTEEEISENKYFTFPKKGVIKNIIKTMEKRGLKADSLNGVPGFYYNTKKNEWLLSSMEGIGIPIINANKNIVGIQVRKDVVEEKSKRYTWLTSTFADGRENTKYLVKGSSPGAPFGVIYPKDSGRTIFITEGHFKGLETSKFFKCSSISVQGVTSWFDIGSEILTVIDNKEGQSVNSVFIAFDADMSHNASVLIQALNMARSINNDFPELTIYFVVWDEIYGKGIDDVIVSGNDDKLQRIEFIEFEAEITRLVKLKQYSSENEIATNITPDALHYFFKAMIMSKSKRRDTKA